MGRKQKHIQNKTEKERETNRGGSIEGGRWETPLVGEDRSGEGWKQYSDGLCAGLGVNKTQEHRAKTGST